MDPPTAMEVEEDSELDSTHVASTVVAASPAVAEDAPASAAAASAAPASDGARAAPAASSGIESLRCDAYIEQMRATQLADEATLHVWRASLANGAAVCTLLDDTSGGALMSIAVAASAAMRKNTVSTLIVQSLVLVHYELTQCAAEAPAADGSMPPLLYEELIKRLDHAGVTDRIKKKGT
jgi:hypothetical protein